MLQTNGRAGLLTGKALWGNDDWSVEAWVTHGGQEVAREVPVFQWGSVRLVGSSMCG